MKAFYFGWHYHEMPAPEHIIGVTYSGVLKPSDWLLATYEPVPTHREAELSLIPFEPTVYPPLPALWNAGGGGYISNVPALPVPDLSGWQAMAVGLMLLALCLRRIRIKNGA